MKRRGKMRGLVREMFASCRSELALQEQLDTTGAVDAPAAPASSTQALATYFSEGEGMEKSADGVDLLQHWLRVEYQRRNPPRQKALRPRAGLDRQRDSIVLPEVLRHVGVARVGYRWVGNITPSASTHPSNPTPCCRHNSVTARADSVGAS